MKISEKFGLTGRLLGWFLFIGLVPVMVIGYLSYTNAQKALETDAVSKLQALHTSLANHVATYFLEQENIVKAFSEIKEFQDQTDAVEIHNRTMRIARDFQGFYDFMVLDKTGKVIDAANPKEVGLDKSLDPYFVNAKDKTYIKDVYPSSVDGTLGFTISAPLITGDGVFNGVVVARYKLEELNKILSESDAEMGKTADTFLVDANSYAMTATNFFPDAILKLRIATDGVKQCLAGQENFGYRVDYRNVNVLGSWGTDLQTTLGKNWCIVAKLDAAEVNAPAVDLRNTILLVMGLILAVVFGLIFFISRSIGEFVRRPIRQAIEQMSSAASQLSASTQQTSAASQQNASIAQQLASGATQQSRQAEEISKAVSELSAALQQMSAFAEEASASANLSSKMVQKTGEDSEKISEMVQAITNISEQTNMLALNAAIEAARAGEAGRGFAVVADEVRKLAENSGQSAEEIKKIVSDIGSSMNDTVKSVQDVSKKIQEVATAIQQQAAGITQIAKTMDSIAAVSEQNASGAQQLSASTQQQSASNQQVAAAAQQLQSLSDQLQGLAGSIKEMEKHATAVAAPINKIKKVKEAAKTAPEEKEMNKKDLKG